MTLYNETTEKKKCLEMSQQKPMQCHKMMQQSNFIGFHNQYNQSVDLWSFENDLETIWNYKDLKNNIHVIWGWESDAADDLSRANRRSSSRAASQRADGFDDKETLKTSSEVIHDTMDTPMKMDKQQLTIYRSWKNVGKTTTSVALDYTFNCIVYIHMYKNTII